MNGYADFIDEETALHVWRNGGSEDSFGVVLYSNFGRQGSPKERVKHHLTDGHLFTSKHDQFGDTDCIHRISRVNGVLLPDGIGLDRAHVEGDYPPIVKGSSIMSPYYKGPIDQYLWYNIGAFICIDTPTDPFIIGQKGNINADGSFSVGVRMTISAKQSKAIGSIVFRFSSSSKDEETTGSHIFVKLICDKDHRISWVCPPHPEWARLGYPQLGQRWYDSNFSCYQDNYLIVMIPYDFRMTALSHKTGKWRVIEDQCYANGDWIMDSEQWWGSEYSNARLFPKVLDQPLTYTKGRETLALVRQGMLRDSMDLIQGRVTNGMPSAVKKKLTAICLKNLQQVSINSIAYLEDILKLKRAIAPIIGIFRKPLNPKSWANLWLTYRYGISLFISDSLEVAKAWQRENRKPWNKQYSTVRSRMPGVIQSGGRLIVKQYHMKMYFCPQELHGFDKLYYFLRRTDLWPSAENVWDLVPFSFVVDWFIPINRYLRDIDTENDRRLFKAAKILLSVKATLEDGTLIAADGFMGFMEHKSYHRWHEQRIPFWNSHTDLALGQGLDDPIHIIDSVSLAIQRRR